MALITYKVTIFSPKDSVPFTQIVQYPQWNSEPGVSGVLDWAKAELQTLFGTENSTIVIEADRPAA